MDSWTDDLDARDRVRRIATTLSRPRSVNWIRQEAEVSWGTAKRELQRLVEADQLRRVHPDGGSWNPEADDDADPRYVPDYKTQYLARIRELTDENSRQELRSEIAAIQDEAEEWKGEYGVESREELEESLAEASLAGDEVRERSRVLQRWERNEETRRLLAHAIRLYDDLADLESRSRSSPV